MKLGKVKFFFLILKISLANFFKTAFIEFHQTLITWKKIISKWYLSALIILFALRELDYDKTHFTHGVLKSRQYFSDLVGFPELIASISILIFIVLALGSIIIRPSIGDLLAFIKFYLYRNN